MGGVLLLTALAAYFFAHRKRRQRTVPADDDIRLTELQAVVPGSDDEDGDYEDTRFEEIVYKGKKYLRDPATNDIFDYAVFMEDGDVEEIGIYNPDTDNIELRDAPDTDEIKIYED